MAIQVRSPFEPRIDNLVPAGVDNQSHSSCAGERKPTRHLGDHRDVNTN